MIYYPLSTNIGGWNSWKNLDIVHLIYAVLATLTGTTADQFTRLIRFVSDRPGHDRRYAVDATKIQQELGWYPTEIFETGIRKTVAWYRNKFEELRFKGVRVKRLRVKDRLYFV